MAPRKMIAAFAAALSIGLSALVSAADIYVAPTGTPQADGTRQKPLDLASALSAKSPARPGDTIYLVSGRYDGPMKGIERVPFDLAVSGAADKPVRIMPEPGGSAHLNGAATLRSSHAHYIGLEIGDLDWDPRGQKHKVPTALNVMGGKGAKVVNCNIFGGAMGTGLWSGAEDLEIYGCLIHDFGGLAESGRGHGHAFYTQNERGTKVLKHNIAWRGCGWNVHVYTQAGQINGFDIIENICYIAGAYKPGQTMDNYLISGYPPADRIRLIGNVGYQPCDAEQYRPNARLTSYRYVVNGAAQVKDNYLMGAFYGLSLGRWQKIEVTGNTIWSTGILVEISSSTTGSAVPDRGEKPVLANYTVDRNTYYANGQATPFKYGSNEHLKDEERLSFEQWRGLGLDPNGKMLPGRNNKPDGVRVFVFPNEHEKGRGHVAVFNWDALKQVEVDLSGVLAQGQSFRIYNCLDITQTLALAKPVQSGAYAGGRIALPMRGDAVSPDFDAFLVVPGAR